MHQTVTGPIDAVTGMSQQQTEKTLQAMIDDGYILLKTEPGTPDDEDTVAYNREDQ